MRTKTSLSCLSSFSSDLLRQSGLLRSRSSIAVGGLVALTGALFSCGDSVLPSVVTDSQDASVGTGSIVDAGGAERDAGAAACASGEDTDQDGICDSDDLCPDVADDQTDTDGDGVGDACECAEVSCDAADSCQEAGLCEPTTGECVYAPVADDTACDDGNSCSSGDSCQAGVCTGGTATVCEALDQCHTAGVCDSSTGECSQPLAANDTACDDGNLCSTGNSCQSGVCTEGTATVCEASDQCHTVGVCEPTTGECSQPVADDNTTCDDGNLCSTGDSCQSGVCAAGVATTCAALDQCHVAGVCEPTTGACSQPVAADNLACDDGNVCTTSESCQSGACTGGDAVTCAAAGQCEQAGVCDPVAGCQFAPATNGIVCSDSDICTTADSCQNGLCAGTADAVCSSAQIVIDWDPPPEVNFTNPSRLDASVTSAFATVGNVELESWAVENYGRTDAAFFESHDHVSNECPAGGNCGNSSLSENQHAFGPMVQGFVISMVGGGNFDLVSLDYRIRDDSQVDTTNELYDHLSTVPGVDTSRVELWFGTTVTIPTTAFTTLDIGPSAPAMGQFATLNFTDVQNVNELYFTSTGNVSFDNVVIVPR